MKHKAMQSLISPYACAISSFFVIHSSSAFAHGGMGPNFAEIVILGVAILVNAFITLIVCGFCALASFKHYRQRALVHIALILVNGGCFLLAAAYAFSLSQLRIVFYVQMIATLGAAALWITDYVLMVRCGASASAAATNSVFSMFTAPGARSRWIAVCSVLVIYLLVNRELYSHRNVANKAYAQQTKPPQKMLNAPPAPVVPPPFVPESPVVTTPPTTDTSLNSDAMNIQIISQQSNTPHGKITEGMLIISPEKRAIEPPRPIPLPSPSQVQTEPSKK